MKPGGNVAVSRVAASQVMNRTSSGPAAELSASTRTLICVLGIALLGVIALMDWVTWQEVQFRTFYLIPAVLLAWYVGKWAAIPAAIAGAVIWLGIDLSYHSHYEYPQIPYINASTLLVASLSFAVIVAKVADRKRLLAVEVLARKRAESELLAINETLEVRVRERTAAAEARTLALQRSEEALTRSTAILSAILAHMREAVIVTDRDGRLRLVNPAAASLFRLKVPDGLLMLAPSEPAVRVEELVRGYRSAAVPLNLALAGRPVAHADLGRNSALGPTGPWLILSSHPLQLGPTENDGVVFVFTDVSADKEMDQAVANAIEEEQQRIGQDLHDGLGQHLVSTAMAVSLLRNRLAQDGQASPGDVHGIATLVDEAITHVRDIARGLFPASLEQQGLASTLKGLADQITRSTRVRCEIEAPPGFAEPVTQVAFHLYRIAQEGVANAIRHNPPDRIIIRLEEPEGALRLSVVSVGKQLVRPVTGRSGLGLAIMHHRARLIQGDLQIYDEPQGDTVVECTVGIATAFPPVST